MRGGRKRRRTSHHYANLQTAPHSTTLRRSTSHSTPSHILSLTVLTSLFRTFELLNPPPDVTTPPCVEEHTISPTPEHWKFSFSSSGRVRDLRGGREGERVWERELAGWRGYDDDDEIDDKFCCFRHRTVKTSVIETP
jgi:hypothetical protein